MLFFRITPKVNYNNGAVTQTVTAYKDINGYNVCNFASKDDLMQVAPYGRYYAKTHKVVTYDSAGEIAARIDKLDNAYYIIENYD